MHSQKLEKRFGVEPRLFEDVPVRRTLNRAMRWNCELYQLFTYSLAEPQVTSPLAQNDPPISLQGAHHAIVR